MKKILYLLCMMLTVMSCNENADYEADNTHGQNPDGTYTLSLTLEDPGKTKAPVAMARYVLEMYEKDLSATPVRATSSTGTFDVTLKKGVDYICLFWADDNASYNADNLKAVSQKAENTSATIAYAGIKTLNTTNFDGAVTLKRAVAEVNFIESVGLRTTENDLSVTYPYASATLNIADGTITRAPGSCVRIVKGSAASEAESTLATDYVLASTAKETLSGVKLKMKRFAEKTVNSAAIQANYKTRVKGSFGGELAETMTVRVNGVDFKFILVKAGTFQMGAPKTEPGYENVDALSWVKITKDYYIGETEITQEQWRAVLGNNPSSFTTPIAPDENTDKYPVEWVSWFDICGGTDGTASVPIKNSYLENIKLKTNERFRLPTESEWEYAARGGHKIADYMRYPGTNDVSKLVDYEWYKANSDNKTHKVGTKLPNPLGLYDMGGNVQEWCNDFYENTPPLGTLGAPLIDPQGPANGTKKNIRGGSYSTDSGAYMQSFYRNYIERSMRFRIYGFRLVLVP